MANSTRVGAGMDSHPQTTLCTGRHLDPGTITNLFAAALILEWPPLWTHIFTEHGDIYQDMTVMNLHDAPDDQQAAAYRLICALTGLFTDQELGYRLILVKD